MKFRQRLVRYLIGVAIGIAVVFMMFPEYDWFSWLPNKQVMKNMRENTFSIDSNVECKILCLGIDQANIEAARNGGKIIFSKSDVKRIPKTYFMVYDSLNYTVEMTDSTSKLIDITKDGIDCPCQ